jgi:hypothetical protein
MDLEGLDEALDVDLDVDVEGKLGEGVALAMLAVVAVDPARAGVDASSMQEFIVCCISMQRRIGDELRLSFDMVGLVLPNYGTFSCVVSTSTSQQVPSGDERSR